MSKVATFLPINGFFTERRLWLEGQLVVINPKYLKYGLKESSLKNAIRLYKLYSPKHLKSRTLRVKYKSQNYWDIGLDDAGYFRGTYAIDDDFDPSFLEFYLKESKIQVNIPEYSKDNIYHVPDTGTLVVSDIDDTILVSHAYNKFRKLATLLVKGALQRKEVGAMSRLYRHLSENYGFIYLSNSEMNLYPLIKNFLNQNSFPRGPIFLREHKKWRQLFSGRHRYFQTKHHKLYTLQLLLRTFPEKKFLLVGDSGQKDPETYLKVAKEFPNQIEKIFIREIRPGHNSKKLALIRVNLEDINVHFEVFHTGNNLFDY